MGYEGLGLFTRVGGAFKPFRLDATKYEFEGRSYYYVLAVGDLDGDGIDELIVRRIEFEAEEDNLELWAWEHDGPVRLYKIPNSKVRLCFGASHGVTIARPHAPQNPGCRHRAS